MTKSRWKYNSQWIIQYSSHLRVKVLISASLRIHVRRPECQRWITWQRWFALLRKMLNKTEQWWFRSDVCVCSRFVSFAVQWFLCYLKINVVLSYADDVDCDYNTLHFFGWGFYPKRLTINAFNCEDTAPKLSDSCEYRQLIKSENCIPLQHFRNKR